jgi:hypothetical protein
MPLAALVAIVNERFETLAATRSIIPEAIRVPLLHRHNVMAILVVVIPSIRH